MNHRTLRTFVGWSGTGVHSGADCRVELRPGTFGDGLVLDAGGHRARVSVDAVVLKPGATALQVGPHVVSTVEHLLAALVAHGVTDALIVVEGPELPIVDGSAQPFWEGVLAVGTRDGPALEPLVVREPLTVEANGGRAQWLPAEDCCIHVHVDFGVLEGGASAVVPGPAFGAFAHARTFAMADDVAALLAAGRGRGATLENTVVWGDDGPRNALRMVDEPVWHKLIDAIGDLALVGRPVRGHLVVDRPSHALHHAAIRVLLHA